MNYSVIKFLLVIVFLYGSCGVSAQSNKDKWRCQHVIKELKMNRSLVSKFTPVFYAYMKDLHEAKDIYDNVKNKYKSAINKRMLTTEQGRELLTAHWQSDAQELQVKQKYTQQFSKLVREQYVYYIFSLSNDKMK